MPDTPAVRIEDDEIRQQVAESYADDDLEHVALLASIAVKADPMATDADGELIYSDEERAEISRLVGIINDL
jgi:hypothetical protein